MHKMKKLLKNQQLVKKSEIQKLRRKMRLLSGFLTFVTIM